MVNAQMVRSGQVMRGHLDLVWKLTVTWITNIKPLQAFAPKWVVICDVTRATPGNLIFNFIRESVRFAESDQHIQAFRENSFVNLNNIVWLVNETCPLLSWILFLAIFLEWLGLPCFRHFLKLALYRIRYILSINACVFSCFRKVYIDFFYKAPFLHQSLMKSGPSSRSKLPFLLRASFSLDLPGIRRQAGGGAHQLHARIFNTLHG